jgi:hypothetical protein
MECPNCTFQNMPGVKACLRCSTLLDLSSVDYIPPRGSKNPIVRSLQSTGDSVAAGARSLADTFRTVSNAIRPTERFYDSLRVPIKHALWALIPGMPHATSASEGRRLFGRVVLGSWLLIVTLALYFYGSGVSAFYYYLAISIHSFSFAMIFSDNLSGKPATERLAVSIASYIVTVCCVYGPLLVVTRGLFQTVQISNMRPGNPMIDDDVLLYAGNWIRPSSYSRGDIVIARLDPETFRGNFFVAGMNIDRLIGLPGDRVESKNSTLSVNGIELTQDQLPLGSMLPDFDFVVPPGRFFVPPSALLWQVHGQDVAAQMIAMYVEAGLLSADHLRGRVLFRLRPWSRFGQIKGAHQ